MTPKTKKYLLVGGGLILATSAIWYFFLRKKSPDQKKADFIKKLREIKSKPLKTVERKK